MEIRTLVVNEPECKQVLVMIEDVQLVEENDQMKVSLQFTEPSCRAFAHRLLRCADKLAAQGIR